MNNLLEIIEKRPAYAIIHPIILLRKTNRPISFALLRQGFAAVASKLCEEELRSNIYLCRIIAPKQKN